MKEHKLLCACESCRRKKPPVIKIPIKNNQLKDNNSIDEIIYKYDVYELARFSSPEKGKYFKYIKREICDYCGEGYIISTKLFDRCAKCGKEV